MVKRRSNLIIPKVNKQKQHITINNHVNTGPNQNEPPRESNLSKWAAIFTIIAGLIATYYFFEEEINDIFQGPETQYVTPSGQWVECITQKWIIWKLKQSNQDQKEKQKQRANRIEDKEIIRIHQEIHRP